MLDARTAKQQITLRPWLFRIAHNECVDLLRGRPPVEELLPKVGALVDDAIDYDSDASTMGKARGDDFRAVVQHLSAPASADHGVTA